MTRNTAHQNVKQIIRNWTLKMMVSRRPDQMKMRSVYKYNKISTINKKYCSTNLPKIDNDSCICKYQNNIIYHFIFFFQIEHKFVFMSAYMSQFRQDIVNLTSEGNVQ